MPDIPGFYIYSGKFDKTDQAFYFSVGHDEGRLLSEPWRFWVRENEDGKIDAYLQPPDIKRKASFHENQFHFANTNQYHKSLSLPNQMRFLAKATPPDPIEKKFHEIFRVIFPHEGNDRCGYTYSSNKRPIIISPPPSGRALEISIFRAPYNGEDKITLEEGAFGIFHTKKYVFMLFAREGDQQDYISKVKEIQFLKIINILNGKIQSGSIIEYYESFEFESCIAILYLSSV
jgi:hypothetical protein